MAFDKWIIVGIVAAVAVAGVAGVIVYETKKKHPKCLADAQCPAGKHCVDGKCVAAKAGCKDKGCPSGQHCNQATGECVPDGTATCAFSADCPTGYGCYLGECTVKMGAACHGDENCPSDWGCYQGRCLDKCRADSDCGAGFRCSSGKCL